MDPVYRNAIIELFKKQSDNKPAIAKTSARQRKEKLRALLDCILSRKDDIEESVYRDFRKAPPETRLTEIYVVVAEIRHALSRLHNWMKQKKVMPPLAYLGSRSKIRYEPKGNCLIISAWNYPFSLAAGPLVSAVAAGNCAIIKPSEFTPNTAKTLKSILSNVFDEREVAVVEGDREVGEELLKLPFNHIFFTGSNKVGRCVMQAAAENLSTVTLELGGKSPAIITESADLQLAARRIAWGKLVNAGQTCIAPDYVLVPENRSGQFCKYIKSSISTIYGNPGHIKNNPDYCRIVSKAHFQRLKNLMKDAEQRGARPEFPYNSDEDELFISPVVYSGISCDSALMQEEIFGPVLPVLTYTGHSNVTDLIHKLPDPLVLYIFGNNKTENEYYLASVNSGDAVINDTLVHYGNGRLPFGGFNNSGIGKAHGCSGFKEFSHVRSVLQQGRRSIAGLFYPPYDDKFKKLIDIALKYF